ncbi:class I SAM-dependent methyltransferase [Streptomyces sp. NRRL S-350]|uniref:class I SAM-dependent methyltransferase n=1 Tax=Streptomyces sp. NRRL S-350 TaxID=1463902 RepID=UPI0004C16EBF|nr:class I SAM-dependent methyltransferase [Streptomyces sp. NRRL S-350]
MRTPVNTAQAQAWNGDEGRHWSDRHDRWNAINEGFNPLLLAAAAIAPDDRVLDIGCGAGQTTRLAAEAATRGSVLGLDLSAPMLERARTLAAGHAPGRIAFEQGDAQIHPLPTAAFDAAISRFGIMFFDDPAAAFANIARALRAGGRLAFVCMADPARTEWVRVLDQVRAALLLPPLDTRPPTGPGMFSLAEPDEIHRLLDAAFTGVRTAPVEAAGHFGRDAADAADHLLSSGPGRHLVELLDGAAPADHDHRSGTERVRAALTTALTPYERPEGVRLRTSAWLVTATRP